MKRDQHLNRLLRQPRWLQQGSLLLIAIAIGWCLYRLYLVPITTYYRAEVLIYQSTLADISQLQQQIAQYRQPMLLPNQLHIYRQLNQRLNQRLYGNSLAQSYVMLSDINSIEHGNSVDSAKASSIDYTVATLIAQGPLTLISWEVSHRSAGESDGDKAYRIILKGQYRHFILFLLALISQQLVVEFDHLSIYQQNSQLFFLLVFTDQTEI